MELSLNSSLFKGTCLEADGPGVPAPGSVRKVKDLVVRDLEAGIFLVVERAGVDLDVTTG